ncbi:Histone-lysine N-methyltransferase SETMAR [Eumeta japonica]|uniref:Histone-lysine N-methyltransferase SETMAR n=1 Tax=Eumeta variegata TaxID=151549 RepID=A0A4C1UZB4_EUMVA|nr:Histone-lysine N-methyltransferase SETMAR [Eumeta japonica]
MKADERQARNREKRGFPSKKGVVFHHDNAKPHISLSTQQILREVGWKMIIKPPYSPDLGISDFHLFRSLQISLATVESFLLLQDYLCITKEIGGDLIIMFGINILRTTTILMVVRVLNAGLINDYISIITEIDETLGTNSCKSTDRRLMRLLVFFWSLACMKLIFDFNMIIGQNSATVFFYNINSFQLYSFVMTFFYYLSLLTLRLKALTKYVGGEEVMFQEEIYERRGHIMRIKVIFALYKKVALWTESLEDRINVPVVFLLLSIYSNLFMPFRMTLQLFSRPSTSGLNVPLASDLCQILMFGINLIVFCESCQMLKGAFPFGAKYTAPWNSTKPRLRRRGKKSRRTHGTVDHDCLIWKR